METNCTIMRKFKGRVCLELLMISVLLITFSVPAFGQVLVGQNFPITTAVEFENDPAVAANPANGEFLAVWHKSRKIADYPLAFDVEIFGQRIASDGAPIGGSFLVTLAGGSNPALGGHGPAITFNSKMNEFFVIYHRGYFGSSNDGIFGQRIAADGSLIGGEIPIFQGPSQANPVIAYNSNSNQYLVVWGSSEGIVHGQIIDGEGVSVGLPFDLSPGLRGAGNPAAIFNPSTNQYLVVFDAFSSTVADVFGQLLNVDGTLDGPFFAITTADGIQAFPSVTLNTLTNQYFIVWEDERNSGISGYNTFGQLINADGSFLGDNISVGTFSLNPKVAFLPTTNQYFVVWVEQKTGTPGTHYVFGQLLASDLSPIGNAFQVSDAGWAEPFVDLAVNPSTEIALIVWPDEQNSQLSNVDIFGQLIDVATQVADISVSKTAVPNPVTAGSNLTYTITVVNHGPDNAIDVILSDILPSGVSFVSVTSSQGTCTQASGTVTCDIGNMTNAATVMVSIIVTAPHIAGTITNTASVSSISNDPDNTNNTHIMNTAVNIIQPIIPPIILQSPSNGAIFDSGSLIANYQPTFSWTSPDKYVRYTILFSISPTDFTTRGTLITRANIPGTNDKWTPAIILWKRMMTLSFNKGNIRDIYWKVIGTKPDRTTVESEVRSLSIGSPQPVTINSPQDGITLSSDVPPTYDFNLNCNIKCRLEFSPLNDFRDPNKIRGFFFITIDPNVQISLNRALTLNQWINVMKLVRGTGYFRIKAWDGINRETTSEVRSFYHPHKWIIKVNYYRNKAGWVIVENTTFNSTLESLYLSGLAYHIPPWCSPSWGYPCDGISENKVIVTWTNKTTGASGRACQGVRIGYFLPVYIHSWAASVPLDATKDNLIIITATDPTGNWGKAIIKLTWSP